MSNEDWDFKGRNNSEYTHGYHDYPARMVPALAARLIDTYGKRSTRLLDPYCGSGTSLVEASIRGIEAFGADINPLARLISEAKTTLFDCTIIPMYMSKFSIVHNTLRSAEVPDYASLKFWFSDDVIHSLSVIRKFVQSIQVESVRMFFTVAFSHTVRLCSFTRQSGFKLHSIQSHLRDDFKPDVFKVFIAKLWSNLKALQDYHNVCGSKHARATVLAVNAMDSIRTIDDESIGLVVTSPPYGDSQTTVSYGQFSRLSNEWLGVPDAGKLDGNMMGGTLRDIMPTDIPKLDACLAQIGDVAPNRARSAYGFFEDYRSSIHSVARKIVKGGYACYVVGNRTMGGITFPLDTITQVLFEQEEFKHVKTVTREIGSKRLPREAIRDCRTRVKEHTINREYVITMRK